MRLRRQACDGVAQDRHKRQAAAVAVGEKSAAQGPQYAIEKVLAKATDAIVVVHDQARPRLVQAPCELVANWLRIFLSKRLYARIKGKFLVVAILLGVSL